MMTKRLSGAKRSSGGDAATPPTKPGKLRDRLTTDTGTLRKIFDSFDQDASGSISLVEVKAALRQMGAEMEEPVVEKLFASADTDGSGAIEFDEFVRVAEKARSQPGTPRAGGFNAVIEKQGQSLQVQQGENATHSVATDELVALTSFINAKLEGDAKLSYLLPIRRPEELFTAVSDGVLLAKLINVAHPETIDERVLNLRARHPIHIAENHTLTLNAAKSVGLTVVK